MFLVLLLLCNILNCEHVNTAGVEKDAVEVKFPHQSSVVIKGTIKAKADKLQMTIKRGELEEEDCVVTIRPQDDVIHIGNDEFEYVFGKVKDAVPFLFNITTVPTEDEKHSLTVGFDGNNAGLQDFDKFCSFKSYDDVDKIVLEEFKHIKSLHFEYAER